jgi:hypothetical protein
MTATHAVDSNRGARRDQPLANRLDELSVQDGADVANTNDRDVEFILPVRCYIGRKHSANRMPQYRHEQLRIGTGAFREQPQLQLGKVLGSWRKCVARPPITTSERG